MACNRGGVFYWCEGNVLVWDDPVREEDEEPKGRQDCGTGQCVEGRGTAQCALVPLRKCLVNRDGGEYCDGNLAVQCGGAGYDRDAHDCSVNGQTCVMYDPGLGNYLRNACVLADTSCRQRYDMSVCADDHTIFSDCIGDHWVSRKTCGEGFLGLSNLSWRCQVFGKVAGTDYTRDECVTDVPCTTPAADLCSPDGALVLRCGVQRAGDDRDVGVRGGPTLPGLQQAGPDGRMLGPQRFVRPLTARPARNGYRLRP